MYETDTVFVNIYFDGNRSYEFGCEMGRKDDLRGSLKVPFDIGEIITLIDSTRPDRFIIDIAFAGRTEGLSGSSLNIGTLTVNPQRIGNIIVDSSATVFRNTVNETITINELDFVSVIK